MEGMHKDMAGPLAQQWSHQKYRHEFDSPNIITVTVTSAQRTPPMEPVLCTWLCTLVVGLPS
eukprot:scaffold13114_cov39-Attheya_sp.AAC.1